MYIYFAGPLFCQAEREFNLNLTRKLEQLGFSVFLPQRDGAELSEPPYNEMTSDEVCQAIFALDRGKLLKADIFLFLLDGRVPDEGGCVELGIAHSQKHLLGKDKLIIGLHTDARGAHSIPGTKLNAMVCGALERILTNEDDLIAALDEYRQVKTDDRVTA